MLKFRETDPLTEVRGVSTVTWVNTSDVCYSKESFKDLLDQEGNRAFIYGVASLRKDKEMCKYAASKGTTIENLYTFGVLDDEIVLESLKASLRGLNSVTFGEQVGKLFDLYLVKPELFMKIVDSCEPGTLFAYEIARSSVKNKDMKSYIAHNREMALKCVHKDPAFYDLLDPSLKNDPDIKESVAQTREEKKEFFAIDGTKFESMEEAAAYNESLGRDMKLKQ